MRLFLLASFIISGLLATNILANPVVKELNKDWWKSAVFYQIYPRSFKDSDNSGVGDLQGVISKLDHLVDAGVSALWLSPIFKSPQKDHGYDVSDFRDIDELFGTMDDFKELEKLAHGKGIRIVMDLVPNHSSDEHVWFGKSARREEGFEDFYIWLDGKKNNTEPPNNWVSYFHGPAWTFNEERGQWYLHQFHQGQPDLNFRDPHVIQEMKDIITYWFDLGVDGFRVDTIPSLVEVASFPDEPLSGNEGCTPNDYCYLNHPYTNDQPETFDMVYQWREVIDKYNEINGGDERVMMTEAYSGYETVFKYYGNETHNGAHFSFNFFFISQVNKDSSAYDIKGTIDKWFEYMPTKHTANWVLGNHDQHRLASRYGVKRADGLIMMTMMLPGVAVSYNGEEIGMEDGEVTWEQGQDPQACNGIPEDFNKSGRDFERTPYQWDTSINAGFNTGGETWLPVSPKYKDCNLADQDKVGANTHYNMYKKVVELRKNEVLRQGTYDVKSYSTNTLAISRSFNGKSYILVTNISGNRETIDLTKMDNIPEQVQVVINSVYSSYSINQTIISKTMEVNAYESVILYGKN